MQVIESGYKVDGEVGRFYFTTHQITDHSGVGYNTATDLFPSLKGKEWYRTVGFKEIAIILGDVVHSYRTTAKLINRVRYQPTDGTPYRTLQANTETEGAKLIDYLEKKTTNILKRHRFSEDGDYEGDPEVYNSCEPVVLPVQKIISASDRVSDEYPLSELLCNPVCFEDPANSVNIAMDDVGVKRQRKTRSKDSADTDESQKRKSAYNTVIRINHDSKRYSLVGGGMKLTLRYLIAFLLSNKLTANRFQFFTDGHTVLNDTIRRCFKWYPNFGIILDWYHLVKKCKELLSLSLRGRLIRNEVLAGLMPRLWHGLTNQGIEMLKQIEPGKIKNNEQMVKLIAYLERNNDMIPCYALRKSLGLCNSSAIGEKMNDLIVSTRQKHNGMSWSKKGSLALAALTTAKLNGESEIWLKKKELPFMLAA
jgi:hypothetical protein